VKDILSNTSRSIDQVTIEPDGVWATNMKPASPANVNGASFSDDDDLIEIKDHRVSALKLDSTPVPSLNSTRTPPTSSREASASVPSGSRSSISGKRPASQVIDLTLSDEDDEPIVRAPKRQFTGYGTPQSMFVPRHNGHS
jgi:E3 SUMO-protein ligase PIAS1